RPASRHKQKQPKQLLRRARPLRYRAWSMVIRTCPGYGGVVQISVGVARRPAVEERRGVADGVPGKRLLLSLVCISLRRRRRPRPWAIKTTRHSIAFRPRSAL